ncbi:MAG: serine hydroxymethyltransferase [Synergistaceae bacterium]|jgi:glycine hydroxymethyltransferase|nr:serine hydroxymethyltransferase [Synergistaceae bacterium]MDD3318565.1 serine hydroxymethyltransferase [Synergistaceae bacterium]MDD3672370.1 serine hydroxymethyltransferase [Synergistaceae bacterium]MDD3963198.1 serine hydroxymethyltransferase [Synergistaceae bacterium]MDD4704257.1 serine hydroxymethyltransferase [Synergistaceae bacterium]
MNKIMTETLKSLDPQIFGLTERELERQRVHIELIASENFVPRSLLEIQGSILTNKYAEGYPYKKYYGGCEFVEVIEEIAIKRACELFGADHANVQPHAGASANQAVFFATVDPGDTVLSMKLDHGGHLSHGHPVNFSGRFYNIVGYGVNRETETIDYDEVERLAKESRPKLIVAGASAYPRFIDFARFRAIADEVGAVLLVDMAHIAGLVAGGAHPNPMPYSDYVSSTSHKTLRGTRGAFVLCKKEYAQTLDRTVFPGIQGGPLVHAIAGKAVTFMLAGTDEFKKYAAQVVSNASALAKALTDRGFRLVSGGTDNHLILLDVRSRNVTGKEGEVLLGEVGITSNKNMIPFDPAKPMITSGVRLGTAAVTTRGMKEPEMEIIADAIEKVLSNPQNDQIKKEVKALMASLTEEFPLYPDLTEPWAN